MYLYSRSFDVGMLVVLCVSLVRSLKVEAQQNSDVKTTLLPIAIGATRAMNVVFPDDKVSEVRW